MDVLGLPPAAEVLLTCRWSPRRASAAGTEAFQQSVASVTGLRVAVSEGSAVGRVGGGLAPCVMDGKSIAWIPDIGPIAEPMIRLRGSSGAREL